MQEPSTSASSTQDSSPGTFRGSKLLHIIARDHPKLLGPFKRALSGVSSPRNAIKCQCLDCQGLSVEAVKECGDRNCPLWHFRPYVKHPKK